MWVFFKKKNVSCVFFFFLIVKKFFFFFKSLENCNKIKSSTSKLSKTLGGVFVF